MKRLNWLAVLGGTADDLVVDVGDVAHVGEAEAAVTQIAAHHVEHQQHARMTHVHVVVHRKSAHVHAQRPRLDRLQQLLLTAERVVDADHANRASRSRALPAGMAFSSGASSGPCARPVSARRSGM
jgi:hypothetical protein